MGKIKKLKDVELVGGTEQSDVYPITSTKAIYDESNKRLDNIIAELQKSADSSLETENKTIVGSINELKRLRDEGYLFKGVATPDTNPGVVKQKVFYIANGKGTYTNFGGVEVTEDDVVVLYWDSSWHKVSTGIASQEKLTELEEHVSDNSNKIGHLEDNALIHFVESGIRASNNFYSQVSPLDSTKAYLVKIITSVSGAMTIKAGTEQASASMVDTLGTIQSVAGQENVLYYKPTGSYQYFRCSVANDFTLEVYECVGGEDAASLLKCIPILKDSIINEYAIQGWNIVPITGWTRRGLDGATGQVANNTNTMNKIIHSDYFQMDGIGRFIVLDGYSVRLFTYDSNKNFESLKEIVGITELPFNNEKYYRLDLLHGTYVSPATAPDISMDEYNAVHLFNITGIVSDMRYKTRSKIYGIRIDNSQSRDNVHRIADAIGLKNDYVIGNTFQLNGGRNDFDNVFPWCDMRLCNVKIVDGIKVVTYQGESGFKRDGSNGDVMVEIPKFYSMRSVNGDNEDICISGEKKSGFEVEPVFIDGNGNELNYVYCGVYLTSVENNTLTSKTGTLPTTNHSMLDYRGCSGEMYDFAMVQCLQKLISIEFGALDIQSKLGGLNWLPYSDVKAYETIGNTNSAIFYSDVLIDQNYDHLYKVDYLYVGECISITNRVGEIQNRKITALGDVIEYEDGGTSRHRRVVTFDGSPANITADVTYLTAHAQESGLSDTLSYHTGRLGLTAYISVDQFKYRNIEGLWGNCGEFMDGIRVKNAEYYVAFNPNDYANLSNYTKLTFNALNTADNVNKYNWKYIVIKKMGYDRRLPNVNLPISVTGYATVLPEYYSCIICVFNGENYSGESVVDVEFVGVSSLAWDAGRFNGIYTYRFWVVESDAQWLYSTRMIYRSL